MKLIYNINGETLVKVRGGGNIKTPTDLGITDRDGVVRILPIFHHQDMHTDSFGPEVPVDVQWMLSEIRITMTLVMYDPDVFDIVWGASCAGGFGTMTAAGRPLGAGIPLYEADTKESDFNNFMSVYLTSPVLQKPWKFLACYLWQPPIELPLGTKRSLLKLVWRAIPYVPLTSKGGQSVSPGEEQKPATPEEIVSSGAVLFTRDEDLNIEPEPEPE